MIQPEDIRRKAENLYENVLHTWLRGEDFFPRVIPAQKQPDSVLATAIQDVQRLRDGSKEVLGYGYSVQWREVNSRKYGRNRFPEQISFETTDDFLRFIHKIAEFAAFTASVMKIRSAFPQLEPWIHGNVRLLTKLATDVDGLIEVVRFLQKNPRPGLFARELPLFVDTKFIERHQGELRQWLDALMPAHAIRADEEHFERRFGLRYSEPHVLLRFLDPVIRGELGFPCEVLSLPIHTMGRWSVVQTQVIIVENKVNLLTLPQLPRTLGLGALGHGVTLLRYLPFLSTAPITYWGDLDVEGLEILSALRAIFPQTRSILMDQATFDRWQHLKVEGTGRQAPPPAYLTPEETAAFDSCCKGNIRIEQERLPQEAFAAAVRCSGLL